MQRVIFKIDDFWIDKDERNFNDVFAIAYTHYVKLSVGVVGSSIKRDDYEAASIAQSGIIEIFNHSLNHLVVANGRKEFFKTDREYQKQSIEETNRLAKEMLGVKLTTIGFPANACDDTTIELLSNNDEIENIYHVAGSYNSEKLAKIGKRIIDVNGKFEIAKDGGAALSLPLLVEDFNNARQNGIALKVYQMHPATWSKDDLATFEAAIVFLKDNGVEFVFPSDL